MLAARALVVSGWTLGSRVLGLARDAVLARAFGGGFGLDAFLIAFALPNMLRNLFGEGALAAAFVPRYVQIRERDAAAGERFAGAVLARLALLLVAICALLMGAALALSLWAGPETAQIARLALPQLPYLILICLAAILAGVLHGRRRFWVPAAAPVILNLAFLAAVWWGAGVAQLPWAVLAAGLLQLGVHVVASLASGGLPRPQVAGTPELSELRRALPPVLFATGVYQLNALSDSLLAWLLVPSAGAVTVLYLANRLFQFPLGLVGHGVATAIYPELASSAQRGWAASGAILRQGTGLLGLLMLPAALGLILVAEPLVRVLFASDGFDEAMVGRCVLATRMLALGLPAVAIAKLLLRTCHAHRDQRTPWRISLIGVLCNLPLNVVLVLTPLREAGLALSSSICALGTTAAYLLILQRRGAGWALSLRDLGLAAAGCLPLVVAVLAVAHWGPDASQGRAQALQALLGQVAAGVAVYGLLIGPLLWRRRATLRC